MEVEDVKEVEDVEDEDSGAESRLARKLASFGMISDRHHTSRRNNSEELGAVECPKLAAFISDGAGFASYWFHHTVIRNSHSRTNFLLVSTPSPRCAGEKLWFPAKVYSGKQKDLTNGVSSIGLLFREI